MRRILVLFVLLGALVLGYLRWRDASPRKQPNETGGQIIDKEPVHFGNRTFDPASPPIDMPPLNTGEGAECDSNFLSNANVGGETRQIDSSHATVTINRIKITLQLNITIWTPLGASQHVIDHEDGHRRISESYYQTADKVAGEIAERYMGKQMEIEGADLNAESSRILQQMAGEITSEYGKELNPEPAQLLYDSITEHSRNEVIAKDAVVHALKNVAVEAR